VNVLKWKYILNKLNSGYKLIDKNGNLITSTDFSFFENVQFNKFEYETGLYEKSIVVFRDEANSQTIRLFNSIRPVKLLDFLKQHHFYFTGVFDEYSNTKNDISECDVFETLSSIFSEMIFDITGILIKKEFVNSNFLHCSVMDYSFRQNTTRYATELSYIKLSYELSKENRLIVSARQFHNKILELKFEYDYYLNANIEYKNNPDLSHFFLTFKLFLLIRLVDLFKSSESAIFMDDVSFSALKIDYKSYLSDDENIKIEYLKLIRNKLYAHNSTSFTYKTGIIASSFDEMLTFGSFDHFVPKEIGVLFGLIKKVILSTKDDYSYMGQIDSTIIDDDVTIFGKKYFK
jgi:hypothetical protein